MHDFGTTLHGGNCGGQWIGIPILKELHHPSNIMFESLGKLLDILIREQSLEIGRFGWVTAKNLDIQSSFQYTRDFIAGENDRNLASIARDPLCDLSLRMRV
jgi:hypothetical protein